MKIIKSKETLILTQTEKAILSKAHEILHEIYNKSENDQDLEYWAKESRNNIEYLLSDAEDEDGEPNGEITVTITM